jgi:two-component system OmpR family sensor kinase
MTAEALQRLRRRLSIFLALALAVAIGVPSFLLARSDADRRRLERDDRLERSAQAALYLAGEDPDNPGEVDAETYAATPRPEGAPATALLDAGGGFVAGDRELPAHIRRAATLRRRRDRAGPATVDGPGGARRIVALSIEGDDGSVGTALSLERTAEVDDEIRAAELRIAGGALATWLLLSLGAVFLVRRALRPAIAAAGREQAFLADAAHELRTPWAIVAARAQQGLAEGARERDEDLRAIAATAAGAGATITDMLELARLDAGRGIAEREPIRLDALVSACAAEHEAAAREAGIDLVVEADGPAVVLGDERLLRRAVDNLLDNAVRHGGAGGQVRASVAEADGRVRVEVSDKGPGIPPGQSAHVFDRFHRGSATAPGGSGLGLPIARLAVEAQGGTLVLAPSAPGEPGARFVLTLPLAGAMDFQLAISPGAPRRGRRGPRA